MLPREPLVRGERVPILPQSLLLVLAPSAAESSASGLTYSWVHLDPGLVLSEKKDYLVSTPFSDDQAALSLLWKKN